MLSDESYSEVYDYSYEVREEKDVEHMLVEGEAGS